MLYNEKIIGDIKDVEVEKLEKTKHKRINRKVCCFNNDNNKFLVNEFDQNGRLMNTLNDAVEGPVNLHYNCVLPIVHKHMRSNKVLSGMIEGKVLGTGAAKIVSFASKEVVFMYVTMESYGYIALVKWRKRKKWNPGWNLNMCIASWSSKFKQWDPGKICVMSNFYNLEDKVVLKGWVLIGTRI
ncbi:receptor protein kinase HSL1 [Trifolium repens]|nr:receptor protein kinase HSL1 [Trifolium repens]